MSGSVSKVLKICEKFLFLEPVFSETGAVKYLKLGPAGEPLRENIKREWIFSTVVNREEPVFPFSCAVSNSATFLTELREQYQNVQQTFHPPLPFGIAQTRQLIKSSEDHTLSKERLCFRPLNCTELQYLCFLNAEDGQRYFYYWSRIRKSWWRQFAADPSHFSVSEIQTDKDGMEFVNIKAEFPWGMEPVETIKNVGHFYFKQMSSEEQSSFAIKHGRKRTLPYVIQSMMTLETAVLAYLCDAFIEDPMLVSKQVRLIMKLHRRLAPYKTTIAAPAISDSELNKELRLLATFLSQKLRKVGIATLNCSLMGEKALDEQFEFHDILGIPYTIVLTERSLSDGVVGLRSRETTLQEQVHASKLIEYVEKIMKSY